MLGKLGQIAAEAVKNAGFQQVGTKPTSVTVGTAKPTGFAALIARLTGRAPKPQVQQAPTGTLTMERNLEKQYTGSSMFYGNEKNLTKYAREKAANKAIAEGLLRQAYDPYHKAIRVVCTDEFPQ